jgi:hypothetical protein
MLLGVGVWCVCYYFWFFQVTNPGETLVNQDRLNERICGVIIGVGIAGFGWIAVVLTFFFSVALQISQEVVRTIYRK